jgi:proteic killer suppression protein
VSHKGLSDFIRTDNRKGLRPDLVARIRRIVTSLVLAPDMSGLMAPPGWRVHRLKGNREGVWSISVSGNWRITFEVRADEIWNLNLEDYH